MKISNQIDNRNCRTLPTIAAILLLCCVGFTTKAIAAAASERFAGPPDSVGPHSKSWATAPGGMPTVELGTGMHYWSDSGGGTGQWLPSDPSFTADADGGFTADKIQHWTHINSQLNVQGAVTVMAPVDGKTDNGRALYITPIAIGLYDPVGGAFEIIGVVTNSTAQLVSSNVVLFDQAFQGLCASYLVTIEQARISADVIFTGRLDPAQYGFNPTNVQIQIISETYQAPDPDVVIRPLFIQTNSAIRARWVQPDMIDEILGFSDLALTSGRAFMMQGDPQQTVTVAPVWKGLQTTADQRKLMVESVSYWRVYKAMESLPVCEPPGGTLQGAIRRGKDAAKLYAGMPKPSGAFIAERVDARRRLAASARETITRTGPSELVEADHPLAYQTHHSALPGGLVIDWVATTGGSISTAMTFDSSTNYFVSSAVNCNGPATIMGGTIFKYKTNASIIFNSTVTCKSAMYRPIVCTGVDDDQVGDSLNGWPSSGYTGTINTNGYANPAMSVYGTVTLNNVHFRYAQVAVANNGDPAFTVLTVQHSQFLNCIQGISLIASGSGSGSGGSGLVSLNNNLISNVKYPLYCSGAGIGYTYYITNSSSTFDSATALASSDGSASISSYNSIYANMSSAALASAQNNGFYNAPSSGSGAVTASSYPFQNAGAGNYYLAASSPFRAMGTTTGVSAGLITDLRKRTVDAPAIVAQSILNTDQVLVPQVQRDTAALSWGWHYDPIDWALGWVLVTNATLTVTNPGTVIATFGTNSGNYGLAIGQNGRFVCTGQANAPNWIVQYNTVQEQPVTNWFRTSYASVASEFQGLSPGPAINCRFTDFSMLSLDGPAFYAPTNTGPFNFRDCEFHGGKLLSSWPTLNLTNCLLDRVYSDIEPGDGLTTSMRNCLVYGCNFSFAPTNSLIQDNLFDKTTITNLIGSRGNSYNGGFNAYVTGFNRLQPTKTSDIILSASPSYQVGPLGSFYLLSSSALINGDTSATADQVGLYHYTLITNLVNGKEIKETNTLVDVSFHWVATDSAGNPIDTSGDGVPDYLRDANGNGIVDTGEINWANYVSANGLSTGNGLQVFTPLK